jgi:large subunit ribosomal protein L3
MGQEVKAENENKTDVPSTEQLEAAPLKGIVGTKIGMTRIFVDDTRMVPVTVVSTEGNIVTLVKTKASDGYDAVQIGYGDVAEKKLSKAEAQHFVKKGLKPKRWLKEFRVKDVAPFKVGQPVPATVFAKGEWLQVSGTTRGKGYAGVMKRHNFRGLPASHGASDKKRSPGSLASRRALGRVVPGQRMAGHAGHEITSTIKIEVINVDPAQNLIYLGGAVPGPAGGLVTIFETIKNKKFRTEPAKATVKKDKMGNIIKAAVKPGAKK